MGAAIELKPMTGNEPKALLTIDIEQRNALSQQVIRKTVDVKALTIGNDEDYEQAADLLKDCKRLDKDIEGFFKPHAKFWHDGHKDVKAQENLLRDPLKKLLDTLGRGMGAYQAECERQRQLEREMLLAQQKAEMDASAMELAEGLAENGQMEAAEGVLAQAAKMQPEVQCDSFAPKVRDTVVTTNWTFEVVDPALVPREYLCVDETKVRGVVKACKGETNIPGIRVFSETKVGARV